MRKIRISSAVFLIASLVLLPALLAPRARAAGPQDVTLTVTAVGKKDTPPPAIARDDVQFFLNKERTQIANWQKGEKLHLAVLIDDSLETTIGNQFGDLKVFFNDPPPTTYIAVFYARNGSAVLVQDFTNDHALVD